MSPVPEKQFRRAVLDLFGPGLRIETFPARVFRILRTLVDCDLSTYAELDPNQGTLSIHFDEPDPGQDAAVAGFAAHMAAQPFTNFDPDAAGGGPILRADFVTHRELRDLGVYTEGFQATGINDHAAIPVASPDGNILFASVERTGRGIFSGNEGEVMREMQPFLVQARQLAVAASAVIPDDAEPGMLGRLGLTSREADVHFWMIQGKSNPEIATILGIRLPTVKEHVSSVFAKLGVDNRYAAILRGLETLRRGVFEDTLRTTGYRATSLMPASFPLPK